MARITLGTTDKEYAKFLVELGERIKQHRQVLDITQRALSAQIGVTPGYFYLVEGGQQNVSLYTVWATAKALGISVDLLLSKGDIWEEPTRKSIEQLTEALRRMTDEQVKLAEQNAKMSARMAELTQACGRLIDKLGRQRGVPDG